MVTSEMNINGLNSVLFEMIDRINDDDLKGDDLTEQLKKASAVVKISGAIARNADLALKAATMVAVTGGMASIGTGTARLLGMKEGCNGDKEP